MCISSKWQPFGCEPIFWEVRRRCWSRAVLAARSRGEARTKRTSQRRDTESRLACCSAAAMLALAARMSRAAKQGRPANTGSVPIAGRSRVVWTLFRPCRACAGSTCAFHGHGSMREANFPMPTAGRRCCSRDGRETAREWPARLCAAIHRAGAVFRESAPSLSFVLLRAHRLQLRVKRAGRKVGRGEKPGMPLHIHRAYALWTREYAQLNPCGIQLDQESWKVGGPRF